MKKALLLSAAVCMALSMSAQKLTSTQTTLSADKIVSAPVLGNSYAKSVIANTVAPKKIAKKATVPTLSDLSGFFVCDSEGRGDGSKSFTESSGIVIETLDAPVEVEAAYEGDPNVTCNVVIYDLLAKGSETYAAYDEKDGTIAIPFQKTYSAEYDYYFVTCTTVEGDEVNMDFAQPFVFSLEEDVNGWFFVSESGNAGFGLLVFDEEWKPFNFGAICLDEDVSMTPCNYICTEEQRNDLKDEKSDWYTADPYGVFIEFIDEETIAIHGFMELGVAYVSLNEEGRGRMETLQPLLYAQVDKGVWDYLGPIKWGIDGQGYVNADATIPYIECGFYNFTFNKGTEDEFQKNCFALLDGENDAWEYYSLGREGMRGGYAPLTVFTLFEPLEGHSLPESIQNAVITPAKQSVFNLAGQRVNKNAKGIVIENGKKFVK